MTRTRLSPEDRETLRQAADALEASIKAIGALTNANMDLRRIASCAANGTHMPRDWARETLEKHELVRRI